MPRKIKGTRVRPKVTTFNCPSCGGPVNIHVQGHTLNVVCPSCKAIIDAKNPNFSIIQKVTSKQAHRPFLPLNSRGKLKGKLWEVTGFIVKTDSGYDWREYLLYNPYEGYRWLVEVDGHWVFYKKIYRAVEDKSFSSVTYKNKKFKTFNQGSSKVIYVEGEFYWRILVGDTAHVRDLIAPPEVLSCEATDNEVNWSLGVHIDNITIIKAFQTLSPPPFPIGVGMVQPSPIKEKLQQNSKIMLASLFIIFSLYVLRGITASNEQVHRSSYTIERRITPNEIITTPEFEISGRMSNVELQGFAPVFNTWFFVDGLLVDVSTQKGIPIPLEISYYRGSDWSEGSQSNSRVINNVPAGRYYLSLKFQKGPTGPDGPVKLILKRDVPINSNIFFAAFLIIIGPFFSFFRSRSFEVQRWSNSDYSPYNIES
ncbi:MAG: DUF4178 domain-containing protein [Bacteriovoracaceae bacterium]|nr:DUF4178 domain-containing protein [Bacteriovoracaceae bacterium]